MATRSGEGVTAWGAGGGPADSLRPFTSTAQVPMVGADTHFASAGSAPFVRIQWLPVPLGLRLAVWTTGLLVVAGLVVLGVNQAFPSWLHTPPSSSSVRAAGSRSPSVHSRSRTTGTSPNSPAVVETPNGPTTGTVTVDSAEYAVVVSTQGPCWVEVTNPGSARPIFGSVMGAGAKQTFDPSNGQLVLQMGSSKVAVEVFLNGSHSPSWQWTPTAAPYQLSFTSTTA